MSVKVVIWVHNQPVVLEDVPIAGDGRVSCTTWTDSEMRGYVLARMDDATDLLGVTSDDLRDNVDRAINQRKEESRWQ